MAMNKRLSWMGTGGMDWRISLRSDSNRGLFLVEGVLNIFMQPAKVCDTSFDDWLVWISGQKASNSEQMPER